MTEAEVKVMDAFNKFMIDKGLFYIEDGQLYQHHTVMIDNYPYTMQDGIRDWNIINKK